MVFLLPLKTCFKNYCWLLTQVRMWETRKPQAGPRDKVTVPSSHGYFQTIFPSSFKNSSFLQIHVFQFFFCLMSLTGVLTSDFLVTLHHSFIDEAPGSVSSFLPLHHPVPWLLSSMTTTPIVIFSWALLTTSHGFTVDLKISNGHSAVFSRLTFAW